MSEETGGAIVPVEQKTIGFYGDELVAVRDEEGTVWVPVRRLCEALGVAFRAQLARIERDPVMVEEMRSVSVTVTDGRSFKMSCLPLKFVRAWLFGISANRVKPEIRDKLIAYQREVIEVIDRHFSRTAPLALDDVAAMRDAIVILQRKLDVWYELLKLREQTSESDMGAMIEVTRDHETRLHELEARYEDIMRELRRGHHEGDIDDIAF